VSSGVERKPGIKAADMIRAFIHAARAADAALSQTPLQLGEASIVRNTVR
jgi:hypothetical protein